jgi:asparagine synthase (glutamine-hydrolysing)
VAAAGALCPPLSTLRHRLTKAALPDFGYAAAFDTLPNDPVLATIAGDAVRDFLSTAGRSVWTRWDASRANRLVTRQQALDFGHYLPDDILVKVDRASMAHSIEVRSPFLDYRVVEWAGRLPRGAMLSDTEGKLPLRQLAARVLPEPVWRSRKRGFGVPLDHWFRQQAGRTFAAERLLARRALDRGWWSAQGVRRMLDAHSRRKGRPFGSIIWRLLMLDAWARAHLDARVPQVPATAVAAEV